LFVHPTKNKKPAERKQSFSLYELKRWKQQAFSNARSWSMKKLVQDPLQKVTRRNHTDFFRNRVRRGGDPARTKAKAPQQQQMKRPLELILLRCYCSRRNDDDDDDDAAYIDLKNKTLIPTPQNQATIAAAEEKEASSQSWNWI
jgi:hypothetical protein